MVQQGGLSDRRRYNWYLRQSLVSTQVCRIHHWEDCECPTVSLSRSKIFILVVDGPDVDGSPAVTILEM